MDSREALAMAQGRPAPPSEINRAYEAGRISAEDAERLQTIRDQWEAARDRVRAERQPSNRGSSRRRSLPTLPSGSARRTILLSMVIAVTVTVIGNLAADDDDRPPASLAGFAALGASNAQAVAGGFVATVLLLVLSYAAPALASGLAVTAAAAAVLGSGRSAFAGLSSAVSTAPTLGTPDPADQPYWTPEGRSVGTADGYPFSASGWGASPDSDATGGAARLSGRQVAAVARSVGWPDDQLPMVVAVSGLETVGVTGQGSDPRARNHTAAEDSRGLMQINVDAHGDRFGPPDGLYDPATNLAAALALWRERGWQPWTTAGRARSALTAPRIAAVA